MEGEGDCARGDVKGAAGHDLVAAVDGDGHYGQAKFQCQLERAVLERAHQAGVGAATLGKDDNRHASMQFLLGSGHGVAQALSRVGVHQNVACHAASGADDGDVGDALAHHPLEVVSQETVDGKDVIGTLMVGDKHVARLVVNELAPHYLDAYQMNPAPHACPPLGGEVTPIVLVEKTANNGDECGDDAVNQHDG